MSKLSLSARTEPKVQTLESILNDVSTGKIRVPKFQRPFVWTLPRQLKLFESIRKEYPIGSLLLWATSSRYTSLARVGGLPVEVDSPAEPGEVFYLLDGHQRISTLYGALHAQSQVEENRPFQIALDCGDIEFVRRPAKPSPRYLPLHKVMDTLAFSEHWDNWRDQLQDKNTREQIRTWQTNSRPLLNLGKYSLPVIYIKDAELEQAVEIFSLLNSTGVRVTKDRIFSALSYSEVGFDLGSEIDRLYQDILDPRGYHRLNRLQVLRTLLATLGRDIYSENLPSIQREHASQMEVAFAECRRGIEAALHFLRDDLGVTSARLLPYGLQFVALSEFFRLCPSPNAKQQEWLRRWFWATSFQEAFFVGSSGRFNSIISDIQKVARDPSRSTTPGPSQIDVGGPAKPLPRRFGARSSRVRASVLMLLDRKPLSLEDGRPYTRDHVDGLADVRIITLPANVPLRHRMGNRIVCSEDDPRRLLLTLEQRLGTPAAAAVLHSHCMDDECLLYLMEGDDLKFIEHREELLREAEGAFLKRRNIAPPPNPSGSSQPDLTGDLPNDDVSDADEEELEELEMS